MQLPFDRCEPGFRSLETLLGDVGGRDADLRETGRMLTELPDRIFVELFQLAPFLVDHFLELFDALSGVLLQSRTGVVPFEEMCFETGDCAGMTLGGQGPSTHDLCALLGEQCQALLRRRRIPGRDVRERIQLRLKGGEALFEIGNARIHACTVRA